MRLHSLVLVMIVALIAAARAQQPGPVPAAAPVPMVKPVAEGVYIFEYRGYQSMFVVDPEGVIATDPMNADAAKVYLAEIRKLTAAPIRYVIYSHHHYDHIAGGLPFKEAGAVFVAHRNARVQLERLKNPSVVLPTQDVDERRQLKVGRTSGRSALSRPQSFGQQSGRLGAGAEGDLRRRLVAARRIDLAQHLRLVR